MQVWENFNNGMQSIGKGASIHSFLKGFRHQLPESTVKILERHSQGMIKLGTETIKRDMTM